MSTLYAIYVHFYEDKTNDSFNSFSKLVKKISPNVRILVVNNSSYSFCEDLDPCVQVIKGTNELWDFSGYQEAFFYLEKKYTFLQNDLFVFCNDTFKTHRNFTWLNHALFVNKFRKIKNNEIVGDFNTIGSPFIFESVEMKGWISTYLFAMKYSVLVNAIPFLNPISAKIDVSNRKIICSKTSLNFQNHLNKWFFPNKEGHGWYMNHTTQNILIKKFYCVINEKYLSKKMYIKNVDFVNVYHSIFFKLLNRFQQLFH